ncbi:MAG: HypC/HybG/HupF family hydrogenase formation chaperone [Chitinispirillaceae bacterium]|jgi:hydrogenase expression/formation protein HypC
MCLAIPGRVTAINGRTAEVDIEGTVIPADLSVLRDVKIGDYVMVHAGLAIQKYDEQEALDNLALIRELFEKTAVP